MKPLLALVGSWNVWYKTQSVMLWLAKVSGLWTRVSIWVWGSECHYIQPLVVYQNTNPPLKNTHKWVRHSSPGFDCCHERVFFFFFFFGGGGGGEGLWGGGESLFSQHDACRSSRLVTRQAFIWGFVSQNQVSRAGTSNYIPWYLLAVITCSHSW